MTPPDESHSVDDSPIAPHEEEASQSLAPDAGAVIQQGELVPVRESLSEIVARLEADLTPRDEHHFQAPFNALRRAFEERGETLAPELLAEELAFSLHAHDHQDPSTWGLYFGPFMSGFSPSGEPWDSPPLTMMTRRVLAYWGRRAGETPHPVMRARYADLLWELPKKLEGEKPDVLMARMAVDAYLEAVEGHRYKHQVVAIAKAKRALEIALSLRDEPRIARARDVLLALEDAIAEDDSLGLWGFCFDTFVEPPSRRVPLTDAQRDKLVADLEARLERFIGGPPYQYHPAGPESASLRLASHYRRQGRKEEVARVLRAYGVVVRQMRGTAAPLVVTHSLEQLYDHFKAFELHQDADSLNELLRVTGEEAIKDMKVISTEMEIPRDELEAYFASMLDGTATEVLLRVAVHYLPKRDELETQLRELAQKAPLSYLMTHVIKDDDGRTIAQIGPLDSDLEGHLIRHISQNMQLSVMWLRESLRRGVEGGLLSVETLLEFLLACPLFLPKRRVLLEAGFKAYVQGDSVAAIHILVPQLEQAIRQLAVLIGAPFFTQRRGGGLHARTLDDLLRDAAIGASLGDNMITYLRGLLTDARGWNVRNNVCHGLASVSMLTMPVADRVVHALLVLALVRESEEAKVEQIGTSG